MDQDRGHPHLLLWYVSGDLEPDQARETEAHLARCRDCAAEAMALASMLQHLRDNVDPLAPAQSRGHRPPPFGADSPLGAGPPLAADSPSAAARSVATGADRPHSLPRGWRARMPALLAAAAVLAVLLMTVPSLLDPGEPVSPSSMRQVQPVVLAPPHRGASDAKVLSGAGPWVLSVVLPFGAPAGMYDLRIEAVDQPAHPVLDASAPADAEGRLSVVVEFLPKPGRFVMSVRPRAGTDVSPYVYAFQTVAGATNGA